MGGWQITDEQREGAVRRLYEIISDPEAKPRDVTSATRALASIDRQQAELLREARSRTLPQPQQQGDADDSAIDIEHKRKLVAERLRELGLTVIDATGSVVVPPGPASECGPA